jgi:hypothetical protein
MTDYDYDDSDNEDWDVGGSSADQFHDEPYDPERNYDDDDADDFDCGEVEDKRLCADIGSEHCSFWCPFSAVVLARNPDDYPAPDNEE